MVPFGLAQAPAYFQLFMNKVLEGLSYAMTYLDDIIIFSKNELEHFGASRGGLSLAEEGWTQDKMFKM